ncbi:MULTISPECIES: hypothetical protein [unclassified Bacillus (in: firmicutes)]|uniref:hypothetical protein n=1 Tax=unclassified Bacillus (in: firmicutes) TaxID=185979 RepID=UPI000BFA2D20|nr:MULTISPECIES: hypothetical protein [unclassified Bacillus (in: firmicutes)]PEU16823.1 hypothetical protein CN524_03615 [Bacillus sp. AFS019443]PEU20348.1 hypothetical protein CN525_04500 [Bacillus sp. AFS014408]
MLQKETGYQAPIKLGGPLRLDLQFFAESGEGEEGTTPPAAPTTPEGGNGGNPEPPAAQEPPKTFSQEDMNNVAAKEAKKAQEKLLKQLGIEDFNSAKDGLAKFREWQDSQKSEQDKLNEQLTTYQTQAKESENTIFSLQAENAAIKAGITEEKNLNAVITLAKTKVSDDVDITKAIEMVVEEFPHFKGVVEEPQENPKPTFTTGQHQKSTPTLSDQFMEAFKNM